MAVMADEDGNLGKDESKKAERKRERERRRRAENAQAFEELSAIVAEIDPEGGGGSPVEAPAPARRRRRKSLAGGLDDAFDDTSGMTRLDLINRTTLLLKRLQQENTELRRRFESGDDSNKVRVSPRFDITHWPSLMALTGSAGHGADSDTRGSTRATTCTRSLLRCATVTLLTLSGRHLPTAHVLPTATRCVSSAAVVELLSIWCSSRRRRLSSSSRVRLLRWPSTTLASPWW